jgi:hypothetical protein
MKSEAELQRAHDLLVGILLKEIPAVFDPELLTHISVASSVLCWVLEHEHNRTFGDGITKLEADLKAQGFTLRFKPNEKNKETGIYPSPTDDPAGAGGADH